jgi:hypothetical protein
MGGKEKPFHHAEVVGARLVRHALFGEKVLVEIPRSAYAMLLRTT